MERLRRAYTAVELILVSGMMAFGTVGLVLLALIMRAMYLAA